MRTKDFILVKVTPDKRSYTYWVVQQEAGLALKADGVPVEPPYVFRNRTTSKATLGAAISAEMPALISTPDIPTPTPGGVDIAALIAGNSTLTVGATKTAQVGATLDGGGALLVSESQFQRADATLPGLGATACEAILGPAAVKLTMAGSGALTIDASTHPGPQVLAARFDGVGTLSEGVILKAQVRSTVSGSGTLAAATLLKARIKTGALAGSGALSADVLKHPGRINVTANLAGAGTLSANVAQGTIFNVVASVAGNDVTVTAQTTISLAASPKVFGIEYGDGPSGVYTNSKNNAGAASSQTVTIGIIDGVVPGHQLSYRTYYNLSAGDPYNTRVYGPAGVVSVPQGSQNITATLSGVGSLATGVVGNITNVNATQSLGTVTVTFTSAPDLSASPYVVGVEYGDGSGGVYTKSKNGPGAVSSQSISIGPLDDVIQGHTLSYRPYYNLTAGDPYTTRYYGAAGEIAVL